jgi:hypothetical protein
MYNSNLHKDIKNRFGNGYTKIFKKFTEVFESLSITALIKLLKSSGEPILKSAKSAFAHSTQGKNQT